MQIVSEYLEYYLHEMDNAYTSQKLQNARSRVYTYHVENAHILAYSWLQCIGVGGFFSVHLTVNSNVKNLKHAIDRDSKAMK